MFSELVNIYKIKTKIKTELITSALGQHLSFDYKAFIRVIQSERMSFCFANVPVHALGHMGQKGLHFAVSALSGELNATIGQIRDKTTDLELLGHLQRRITKPHPLHPAGIKNRHMRKLLHKRCKLPRAL